MLVDTQGSSTEDYYTSYDEEDNEDDNENKYEISELMASSTLITGEWSALQHASKS